ncbi:LysM peptidoglycan-binding domain-containing protein [Paenibacillus sp. N3.4]|uniref:LysM peptidoglycan-binding domain-containing protein n=1 Tax=Paenibacillus sp. N3.4 TaxID=2603222 RepID=UPI0011CAD35E|nr:LysM peptidoglycan-binding domain-containing protein [Paenibacillus sp. N3.4]TXK84716.1 LysM peptidoglycan-binding domain-containing protein [Paenibacillus sp. N3.4]
MSEQQPGLRFDIYERVHLQEGLAGIQELNDVELLPHIQVLTQDDQAILKGNLLLTGNYFSDEGQSPRTLEHMIPVEITLPLNRIHRVEDIQVEIENFDIDLLSARSLNVTGVLSLQGVEVVSVPLANWNESEVVTFVHEVDAPRFEPPQAYTPEPIHEQWTAAQPISEAPMIHPHAEIENEIENWHRNENEAPFASTDVVSTEQQPAVLVQEPTDWDADGAVVDVEQTELKVAPHHEHAVVTEEKKDLKVAFGKKANEAVDLNPYGIKSLLSKAGSYLTDKRKAEEEAQAALAAEARIDAVEWKRLFLQSSSGSQEFRKLKLCIVQREDTLESIAKKYQLNPRELQLLNRLGDQEVTLGQVIYLPG